MPESRRVSAKDTLTLLMNAGRTVLKNGRAKALLRWIVLLAVVTYLTFKISAIGWGNVLQALPSSPIFYVLSLIFVGLPILTERLAFGMATNFQAAPPLTVFIRKHVINKAVMNYAGEGYFVSKLSKLKHFDLRKAAVFVKDLAIIRTFAANIWVVFLVLTAIALGNAGALQAIIDVSPVAAVAVISTTLGVCVGGVLFFRKLTRLGGAVSSKIAALYFTRSLIAAVVLMTQWNLVLPETPLAVWALFLVVYYLAKKSPVGGELVFVSVALSLPGLGGDSAAVVAMLLTTTVVLQIIYALGFVLTSDFCGRLRNLASQKNCSQYRYGC